MSEQFSQGNFSTISVEELALILASAIGQIQLIDVREAEEVAIAALPGFIFLPLSQFQHWSKEIKINLNPERETLVLCHHGFRSAQMCQWLIEKGFRNVKNISGGIDAYSLLVDKSIPRY